jgi:O-antigen/teichoic acid export membrane protein
MTKKVSSSRDRWRHFQASPSSFLSEKEMSMQVDTTTLPFAASKDHADETVTIPDYSVVVSDREKRERENRTENWDLADYDTMPMYILKDLTSRQGESLSDMSHEISGAAGGAAIVGVGNIVGSVLKFGCNYLLQVRFGAIVYGLYSISLALVQLIASLCNLGLGDTSIRYTAIYQSKRQRGSLYGVLLFCTGLAGVVGLLGALALIVFSPAVAIMKKEPQLVPFLGLMAPLVPLLSLQTVWFGALQGIKLFKWRVFSERIITPAVLLLALLCFFVFSPSIFTVTTATIVSIVMGTAAGGYFLYTSAFRFLHNEHPVFEVREWVCFSVFNFLTSITEVVLESIDTLLLVICAVTTMQVGQYNAAVKISDFVAMPLFSMTTMFSPTIAELHSRGEYEKLSVMYQVVNKWIITLSLPIFLIATLFSKSLLQLSGHSFVDAWPLLVVSAIGSMVNAATGSVGYMLLMTGYQKWSFINSVASVVLNTVFGILLIPFWGAMGTALGTTITLIIVNIMRYLEVRFLLKMYPYGWDVLKPFGAGLLGAILVGSLLVLMDPFHVGFRLLLIPVFLVCYSYFLWLFKVGPADMIVINALRNKVSRRK